MILFNLIFTRNLAESSKDFNIHSSSFEKFSNLEKTKTKKIKLAYIVKKPDILSESKESLSKKNFIQPNIWQNLFNNFWEQGVFLSKPNKISDKYILELNYLNIRKQQNFHKYLVSKFSRSLFDGSIRSSFANFDKIKSSSNSDVFYLWSKNLKLKQSYLFSLFQKNQFQHTVNRIQSYLSSQVNFNNLPVFTVSNNLGQMIISELPEGFQSRHKKISSVSDERSTQYLYHGWFFINHRDAKEYMEHIIQIYGLKNNSLKIFTCNISTLYKIMSKFNHKIEFRLIPDLQEISKLIKKYRYSKNIEFHANQQYSKKSFRGQPIYLFNQEDIMGYDYIDKNKKKNTYDLAFTNYDTAVSTWNKINYELVNKQKDRNPSLLVYNLEDFITTNFNSKSKNKLLLVPSEDSYTFTKKYQLRKKLDIAYNALSNKISSIELWSKRILWSLTSRQP